MASFCKAIVDATAPYCVAYKPNLAFFESLGASGIAALEEVVAHIRTNYPPINSSSPTPSAATSANTAALYARTFFRNHGLRRRNPLTPTWARTPVKPFLGYEDKWSIVLALTSNASSSDFETVADNKGVALYERVIRRSRHWGSPINMMYVVGATKADKLAEIRELAPVTSCSCPA